MTHTSSVASMFVVLMTVAACTGPTAPADPNALTLGRSITSPSYEFKHAAGDTVEVDWQEAFHAWATSELGITPPRRIRYHKYFSRNHMQTQTGVGNTNAYADPNGYELHTIWPRDNHEVIHLYSSVWGRAVALWSEGLAVSYQTDPVRGDLVPKWSGVALHDRARQFLAEARLIRITDLLTTADFRRFDPNITYPEAGSFMLVVRAVCGLDGVQRLFRAGSPENSAAVVRQQFAAACGRSIDEVEAEWLGRLR